LAYFLGHPTGNFGNVDYVTCPDEIAPTTTSWCQVFSVSLSDKTPHSHTCSAFALTHSSTVILSSLSDFV